MRGGREGWREGRDRGGSNQATEKWKMNLKLVRVGNNDINLFKILIPIHQKFRFQKQRAGKNSSIKQTLDRDKNKEKRITTNGNDD